MTKKKYLEIRGRIDFQLKKTPLLQFFGCEVLLFIMGAFFVKQKLSIFVIPIISVIMFRNFSMMHEAVHRSVSKNKRFNDIIGFWAGCLCLLPFEAWRDSHLQHHLWSGNIERDPVMGLRIYLPKTSENFQKFLTICWRMYIPVLAILQYLLFWRLAFIFAKNTNSKKKLFQVSIPGMTWCLVLFAIPLDFTVNILVPSLVLYMLAVEVINFPHHLQLPMFYGENKAPVWSQYKTSRTCVYPKWFSRLVLLNFNFHTEHHMFPDAPWYELDSIHAILQGELGEVQNLDILFAWTTANRPRTLLEVISERKELKKMAS